MPYICNAMAILEAQEVPVMQVYPSAVSVRKFREVEYGVWQPDMSDMAPAPSRSAMRTRFQEFGMLPGDDRRYG